MGFLLAGNALLVLFVMLLILRKVYGDDWEGLYEVCWCLCWWPWSMVPVGLGSVNGTCGQGSALVALLPGRWFLLAFECGDP